MEKKAPLTLLGTEWTVLKTNYPLSLHSITPTSKELVAVEKALIFDSRGYSGCKGQDSVWKPRAH